MFPSVFGVGYSMSSLHNSQNLLLDIRLIFVLTYNKIFLMLPPTGLKQTQVRTYSILNLVFNEAIKSIKTLLINKMVKEKKKRFLCIFILIKNFL